MRCLGYILGVLTIISCNSNKREESESLILFPSINITLITGDEAREEYQMEIYSEGNTVFGKKIEPNYYYGAKTDSIWLVELDSAMMKTIREFIETSKRFIGDCPIQSTSIDIYYITIEHDTSHRIYGNCDWNGLDYFSLEQKLFEKKFSELNRYRSNLKDSMVNALKGEWVVNGLKKEMKQNELLQLQRTDEFDEQEVGTVIWSFGDSLSFNSSNNKKIDLTYSKSYGLNVKNGSLDLIISPGFAIQPNEGYNYGVYLTIEKIETEKITLQYWWR